MLKTRTWILLISLLLVGSAGAVLLQNRPEEAAPIAAVWVDGTCVRRIDLRQVKERELIVISTGKGTNTLCVEPGRICILDADCPDRTCVRQGWLGPGRQPVVCLPHRLVLQREPSPDDAGEEPSMDALSQ